MFLFRKAKQDKWGPQWSNYDNFIETDLLFLENNIIVGTALRVFILSLRPYKKEKKRKL